MSTKWCLIAATSLLSLTLAACGTNTDNSEGTNSENNSQQPKADTPSTLGNNEDRQLSEAEIEEKTEKYQQCLRENGYNGQGGGQELKSDGSDLAGLAEAAKKCMHLHLWAGEGGAKEAN